MIQPQDFEIIREFDLARTADERKQVLDRRGDEVPRFLTCVFHLESFLSFCVGAGSQTCGLVAQEGILCSTQCFLGLFRQLTFQLFS